MQDFDPANNASTKWTLNSRNGGAPSDAGEPLALFFEDLEALAGLPFLIGKFAAGGIEKAVVVGGGLRLSGAESRRRWPKGRGWRRFQAGSVSAWSARAR